MFFCISILRRKLSIPFATKFWWRSESKRLVSSNCSLADAIQTRGPATRRAPNGAKQWRTMYCAVSTPLRPAAADIITTGLSFQTLPGTRLIQSSEFLKRRISLCYIRGWSQSPLRRFGLPCKGFDPCRATLIGLSISVIKR